MSPFRLLDPLTSDLLVRHLGCQDTVQLLLADPTLLPCFSHSLHQQRLVELLLAMEREIQEALSTWPHLLNGIPGASRQPLPAPAAPAAAPVPGTGYTATCICAEGLGSPATTMSYRWAKKLLHLPGWPDTVWTTTVSYCDEKGGYLATVSVHPTDYFDDYEFDLQDDCPEPAVFFSFFVPQYTLEYHVSFVPEDAAPGTDTPGDHLLHALARAFQNVLAPFL